MQFQKIFPGVYQISVGVSEEITPVKIAEKKPLADTLCSLPDHLPIFDEANIRSRISAQGTRITLPMLAGEGIYGFGLQLKAFNHSGGKRCLRSNADPQNDAGDSHAPVPFYVSTRGYGVLVDTARCASFYCGCSKPKGESLKNFQKRREHIVYTTEDLYGVAAPEEDREMLIEVPLAQGVDLYLFCGDDMKDAVARYNLFSGGGCLPAMWGLGIWYRAFASCSFSELAVLAQNLRKDKIPCDVFGIEPGWQSYSYSCSFCWDDIRAAGHEEGIRKLNKMGFRVNLWEHAYVHPTAPFYEEIAPFCGEREVWGGLVPDFLTEDACRIFEEYHRNEFAQKGISGFKLDECDGSDFTGG